MAGVAFDTSFSAPLFTGGATNLLVPHMWDVAIAGRGYMIDRKVLAQQPLVSSIRATRAQSDGSTEPGEQSLNPDDLWRRSQSSFHLGAGQTYLDRDDSLRSRYNTSKGIDPWTRGQVSLLKDTTQSLSSANTNLILMPAGSRLYVADGTALKYTTDLSSWTTVTGTSGSTITGLASDGYYVWIADGANVYVTNTGTGAASSWTTTDADLLGYVKNRLMYSDGNILGYVSNMATPTLTALFTHNSTNFTWVGFAEGPNAIYAAGYVGDKSLIYRVSIVAEGTSLGAPTVAGELPDGEIVYSIGSYLGFIFLGTSAGARFCTADSNGNLTIGAVVSTANPVRCFEGQGEYVWFGNTNYDSTSTGLGRMSLRYFADTSALKPAYASDLMVTAQANVLSVCTFSGRRVFSVSGTGVYAEHSTNLVSSGTLTTGRMNYGISEKKIPLFFDATFKTGFAGTVTIAYALDGSSTFTTAGTVTTSSEDTTTVTIDGTEDQADQIELQFTLARSGSDSTAGPTLLRHTVRSQPVPAMRRRITLPLLLAEKIETRAQRFTRMDVGFEFGALEALRITKQVVTVQVGEELYSAVLEDFDFVATHPTASRDFWQGTAIVQFKSIS